MEALPLGGAAISTTMRPIDGASNLGGVLNRFSYGAFLRLPTAPYHRTINRWRKETLKLPPTSLLASELDVRGRPIQRLV